MLDPCIFIAMFKSPLGPHKNLPVHIVNKGNDKSSVILIIDAVDGRTWTYDDYLLLKKEMCFHNLDISS